MSVLGKRPASNQGTPILLFALLDNMVENNKEYDIIHDNKIHDDKIIDNKDLLPGMRGDKFILATQDNITNLLIKLIDNSIPQDDYEDLLCIVQVSDIEYKNGELSTQHLKVIESYKLNIRTCIKFNINLLPIVFNTLTSSAFYEKEDIDDIMYWLNNTDYIYTLYNMNKISDKKIKQDFINTIRTIILIYVSHEKTKELEMIYLNKNMTTEFRKLIPYYASAIDRVNVLEWWYNISIENDITLEYDEYCIDRACNRNYVNILKWWFNKLFTNKLILKYTTLAMDWATMFGNTKILKCWKKNKNKLEELNYQLKYTSEGFNISNVCDYSYYKKKSKLDFQEERDIYGSFSFNMALSKIEFLGGDYPIYQIISNTLFKSMKWWSNSGLKFEVTFRALKYASHHGDISLLNDFRFYENKYKINNPFKFKHEFEKYSNEKIMKFASSIINNIDRMGTDDKLKILTLYWWKSYTSNNIFMDLIKSYDNWINIICDYESHKSINNINLIKPDTTDQINKHNLSIMNFNTYSAKSLDECYDLEGMWESVVDLE